MNGDRLPAVVAFGNGHVLLSGAAVVDAWHLARYGVRAARQDGIPLPTRITSLVAALQQEAGAVQSVVSATGPTDVRNLPDLELSEPDKNLTATEVAQMMQRSDRHVRRCAETLGGRKVGRCWVFSRAQVVAYLADRREVAAA